MTPKNGRAKAAVVAVGVALVGIVIFAMRGGDRVPVRASAIEQVEEGSAARRVTRALGGEENFPSDLQPQGQASRQTRELSAAEAGSGDESTQLTAAAVAAAAMPGESEEETRGRLRYEQSQRNAYKFRKLDPEKIKPTELAPALAEAGKKYNIPMEILAAMMYVETGGTHRDGAHTIEGGYGVMALKENNITDTAAEAAQVLGKPKEEILYDQKLNIEAAAALLARYYEDAVASGLPEGEAWYTAVSQYTGRPNPDLASALADETAGWMMKGFTVNVDDGGGVVTIPPNPNPIFKPKNWKLVGMQPPAAAGP